MEECLDLIDERGEFYSDAHSWADRLFAEGKKLAAREKWQAIIKLYGGNAEFDTFTQQATDRMLEASATK